MSRKKINYGENFLFFGREPQRFVILSEIKPQI